MGAPKGNTYWKIANPELFGHPRKFKNPKDLWGKACEYFKWCDDNPWQRNEPVKGGDHFGETVQVATERPYTIGGLCTFLGCDEQTLSNYEKTPGYEDFFGITRAIKRIIYTQKFEGAAVGAFNANIIARDLGLVDKQEVSETKIKVTRKPAND